MTAGEERAWRGSSQSRPLGTRAGLQPWLQTCWKRRLFPSILLLGRERHPSCPFPPGSLQNAHPHASPRGIPAPGRHPAARSPPSRATGLRENVAGTRHCWGEVCPHAFACIAFVPCVFVVPLWSTWTRLGIFSGGSTSLHFSPSCCCLWDAVCFRAASYLDGRVGWEVR